MKHTAKYYAKAFCEAALEAKDSDNLDKIIRNFMKVVTENRDQRKLKEIFRLAEKEIFGKTGCRKMLVESARPLSEASEEFIKSLSKPTDRVEKKINRGLVAGIRITINDELLYDGSLCRKLKKIICV